MNRASGCLKYFINIKMICGGVLWWRRGRHLHHILIVLHKSDFRHICYLYICTSHSFYHGGIGCVPSSWGRSGVEHWLFDCNKDYIQITYFLVIHCVKEMHHTDLSSVVGFLRVKRKSFLPAVSMCRRHQEVNSMSWYGFLTKRLTFCFVNDWFVIYVTEFGPACLICAALN